MHIFYYSHRMTFKFLSQCVITDPIDTVLDSNCNQMTIELMAQKLALFRMSFSDL